MSLPEADQGRARAFQVDVLGLELVADTVIGPGMRWVQVRPAGGSTSITLVHRFPTMAPGSSNGTVLESDDLDSDVARPRARGAAGEGDVQGAPWGRFVTFDDPGGNGLILQEIAGG